LDEVAQAAAVDVGCLGALGVKFEALRRLTGKSLSLHCLLVLRSYAHCLCGPMFQFLSNRNWRFFLAASSCVHFQGWPHSWDGVTVSVLPRTSFNMMPSRELVCANVQHEPGGSGGVGGAIEGIEGDGRAGAGEVDATT